MPAHTKIDSLLILGASVRAAAQSAVRTGIRPICGDLFADADLPESAIGQVARRFPSDLLRIAKQAPPVPWMYTGGLENYPHVVASVSRERELFGTSQVALRRVRDPFELGRVLHRAGYAFPDCRATSSGLPRDATWLRKNRRSSGGLRVQVWRGEPCKDSAHWYYQHRVAGMPASAVFLAAARRGRLLGVTEQLLAQVAKSPFQYAGSIGPVDLAPHQQQNLAALGDLLASHFDLRGLFGVDLVIDADDVWTIEVNPRYTASIEVLERTLGFNAISLHIAACRDAHLPDVPLRPTGQCSGKSILYAERPRLFSAEMVKAASERNRGVAWPAVADIPRTGTQLQPGHPVLTVLADAGERASVEAALRKQTQDLRRRFDL